MATDEVAEWPAPKPDQYQEALQSQIASRPDVEPFPALVDAIVAHESGGNPKARGKIGEVGLMQISPALAKDYGVSESDLENPDVNLTIGKHYLGQLLHKYDGNIEKALMAFNGGPGHVDDDSVSPAARSYAGKVMETFGNMVSKGMGEGQAVAGEPGAMPDWWEHGTPTNLPKQQAQPPSEKEWGQMLQKVKGGGTNATSSGASPSESLGEHLGRSYRENVAKPLTGMVQSGLEKVAPYMPGNPFNVDPHQSLGLSIPTKDVPQNIAESVVPQTATDAAVTLAGFALPAVRGAGTLAEGIGPVKRALSTAMGNIAGTTAIGAGAGALTGEGATQGAEKGLAVGTLGNALRGATGMAGRYFGEGALADKYSTDVANHINKLLPRDAKVANATDVFDNLARDGGEAQTSAAANLTRVKQQVSQALPSGTKFDMPIFNGVDAAGKDQIQLRKMTFGEADHLLSDYGKRAYSLDSGEAKDTYQADHIRKVAYQAKQNLIKQLSAIKPGAGEAYRAARKGFATTEILGRLVREPDIFDETTGQLSQTGFSDAMGSGGYYKLLQQALDDPKEADAFVRTVGRGYVGAAKDIPSQSFTVRSGSIGAGHGLYPRLHPHLGSTVRPVGQLPWYGKPFQGSFSKGIPDILANGIIQEFTGDNSK